MPFPEISLKQIRNTILLNDQSSSEGWRHENDSRCHDKQMTWREIAEVWCLHSGWWEVQCIEWPFVCSNLDLIIYNILQTRYNRGIYIVFTHSTKYEIRFLKIVPVQWFGCFTQLIRFILIIIFYWLHKIITLYIIQFF